MSGIVLKHTFHNVLGSDIFFHLEPFNELFTVKDQSILSVEFSSEETGHVATWLSSKYYTLWLWPSCVVTAVSIDGQDCPRPSSTAS